MIDTQIPRKIYAWENIMYSKCSKILNTCKKGIDKTVQTQTRLSLFRAFLVCYSDKNFVNGNQQKEKSVLNFRICTGYQTKTLKFPF